MLVALLGAGCASPGSALTLDAQGPGATCSTPVITGECSFGGYGSECTVPCSLPATCTFSVAATWRDGTYRYQCPPTEGYRDCVCERGQAFCAPWSGMRERPRSWCEHSSPGDGGARADGGAHDAALDAPDIVDAGAPDASDAAAAATDT